jgi:uncharacterized lipoprotein YbaY
VVEGSERILEGEVHFDDLLIPIDYAIVRIRLEDVSRADAASEVVSEIVLNNVDLVPGERVYIPFSLRHPALAEKGRYSISVHADVDGDGDITSGDYITMESFPVTPPESREKVSVHVRKVG